MPIDADLVAIRKTSSLAYINAVFDCYAQRRVAVPIDDPQAIPDGDYAFAEILTPADGGGWFARPQTPIDEDGPAHLAFSSGTTGEPKAIMLSHRALADVTTRLIEAMSIDPSIREYLAIPVTYSFGLGRARVIAAVGGQLYLPQRGFDPLEFARMLGAGEVNALAAVPSILRVLIANAALIDPAAGRMLRWLEIGSQPMSADEKRAVRALFPEARIVQHYGLTEASRTTFLDIGQATDAALESIGKPTGSVELRIDEAGLICIRGPHVAEGILRAGAIEPIVDSDGWLKTGDLGRIDEAGFVHFLGRADNVLNVGGIKVPAELFEERLAERLGADGRHVAVASMADRVRGEVVMVAYRKDVARDRLADAARTVGSGFHLGAADVVLVEVEDIPRTETGKVRRNLLTQRHGDACPSPSAAAAPAEVGMTPTEERVARIWCDALGVSSVSRDDSFFDIGGDSLSAITAALRAEQHGMPKDMMQMMFDGRTVAQIAFALDGGDASLVERSSMAVLGDTINVLRGLLVLLVIGAHWGPFLIERTGALAPTLATFSAPMFQLGTPGFAMAFGMGLSFFYMPMLDRSPAHFRRKIRSNVLILGGGLLALAAVRAAITDFDAIWPERLFYNVILGYLILMISVPMLMKVMRITPFVVLNCLLMSALSLTLLMLCQALFDGRQFDGFANLAVLMLTSAYSLPQMVGAAGIGAAMGYWLRRDAEQRDLPGRSVLLSVILLLSGSLLLIATGGFFAHPRQPHFFILYAGVVLLLFTLIRRWVAAHGVSKLAKPFFLLGILAFPAFILHEMVIPLKDIGLELGLPYALALPLALSFFLAVGSYAMLRVNRIYFPDLRAG